VAHNPYIFWEMKHKHRYWENEKVMSKYCLICGKYKHKEGIVKKVMQDKIFRVGGGLLLIGIGCIIGMGIIVFKVGHGYEYRIRFIENSVSAMVRPVFIKDVAPHRHRWGIGEAIYQGDTHE